MHFGWNGLETCRRFVGLYPNSYALYPLIPQPAVWLPDRISGSASGGRRLFP